MNKIEICANLVDIFSKEIYPAIIKVEDDKIASITRTDGKYDNYILPGLIDSHIHIESSLLIPSEFARLASVHGTVCVVSDPHEIANIIGIAGVRYMIENGKTVPFKFYFGAPSCVPATDFETSGARLGIAELEELFDTHGVQYLSEVMNYPGVINNDPFLLKKIAIAKKRHLQVDGHAPGLSGEDCIKYISAGITSDHECITTNEALFKLAHSMKIHIREGSASKDFDTLVSLIDEHYENIMFCSDDKHPDDLTRGHINDMVKRAFALGIDKMKVLQCACINPVKHYGLDVGLLQKGDPADFIVVDNLDNFNILHTYIDGVLVASHGKSLIEHVNYGVINNFNTGKKTVEEFEVIAESEKIKVIKAIDEQIMTDVEYEEPLVRKNMVVSDIKRDILKLTVVNRYENSRPAIGFIKNFGLKSGAIGSSIAHDSHNIIAVGVTDKDIAMVVNEIIDQKGAICIFANGGLQTLPLPVCGIMSNGDGYEVAKNYDLMDKAAKALGCKLKAPFMTLSFMALLVIPKLKLSDMGLFDVELFDFTDLFGSGD
ncbi:MAG: adenine deaminase [Candidatus Magnetoovum sp. WYHC-5]|nr:adenine deaminase [Candidatus Magnetoovum sp. WYHC-5]